MPKTGSIDGYFMSFRQKFASTLGFSVFFLASSVFFVHAQETNDQKFSIQIDRSNAPMVVDGNANEAAWKSLKPTKDFFQSFPYDTGRAQNQTEIKITFNDQFLFIHAVCYQEKFIVSSLRRDFGWSSSDIFFVVIDPFRDKLNGFYFAVTPYGVQKEALLANAGDRNAEWDNKWYSEAIRYEDRYEVEMAIPFKTLRYKQKSGDPSAWNINFGRNNLALNERSSWAPVPRVQSLTDLAFCGKLDWMKPPPSPGSNISLIPFGLLRQSKDFEKRTPADVGVNAGFDAKVAVTSSLNLDLTVNPDFAQVEVDRQVTNLSRFELFFPERRQFFLENSDLFGSFGFSSANPFFSRRIGIGRNVNNGENVSIPILFGARLSGRINKDWRVGVLNMTTAKSDAFGQPVTNYGTYAVQRRIGERNNLGAIFVNKDALGSNDTVNRFNRVAGLDFNFASANSRLVGKVFYHQGFSPSGTNGQNAMGARATFTNNKWNIEGSMTNIGANYNPAVGFNPRTNFIRNNAQFNRVFFPKGKISKLVNSFYIGPDYDFIYGKGDKRLLDWDAGLYSGVDFQNGAQMRATLLRWDYTYLFNAFDPSNTGGLRLPANTSYLYFSNRIWFASNPRNKFFYTVSNRFGQYFNGKIMQLQTTSNLRLQPYATIGLDVNYTAIRLPAPYGNADIWLIGPRADITFSRSVFFTTFFQYNTQANNININARLQYRFKPVSDIFLVYTDNYFATDGENGTAFVKPWQPKNRAIVLKATYWLNL
ncbi:MAG: hydrolase [Bacteroidetes bacterium]|nr:MAG: hydrolase [Bacteroidota bacterium]